MLNIIVAICHHNAIGYQGRLLCPLQVDLQRFKQLTWGQKVIMGRKTYEALPSPKLPNREKWVLTAHKITFPDATALHSIDDILALDRPDHKADSLGVKYTPGFIANVLGDTYLKQHEEPEEIEYYLCGPPMMAKTVLDLLHSLGVEDDMIRFDNFGG